MQVSRKWLELFTTFHLETLRTGNTNQRGGNNQAVWTDAMICAKGFPLLTALLIIA